MGIHPAVLDAVLHAAGLAVDTGDLAAVLLARGIAACRRTGRVRARITALGADAMSVEVADAAGLPVLTVRSLATRPMSAEQLHAAATTAGGGPDHGLLEVVSSQYR